MNLSEETQARSGASVSDRMSRDVLTVGLEATSEEIARLLSRRTISAVPVIDDEGRPAGIVSSTDLLRLPAGAVHAASTFMTSPVIVARPDEALDQAAWRLVAARVHRLVVTKNERVVGVLSARDVLEELMSRPLDARLEAVMSTPVEAIPADARIDDAAETLVSANVHGLVVIDGTSPIGVFTHAEALASRRLPPSAQREPVERVMSHAVLCLDGATPIRRAAAYAVATNARRILVLRDKELVGIASCLDLVGVLARTPLHASAQALHVHDGDRPA